MNAGEGTPEPSDPSAASSPEDTVLIAGEGEMAARTRAFDWAATSLGPIASWPAYFRTVVQTVLAARQPMFLWWGPDLIQFYNDAYRPSLGADRHPAALGARGRTFWVDAWAAIGPQVEAVLQGASTWHEDHLVPILRNGRLEDVYWTYGYTPVRDDVGAVAGVLATVIETTAQIHTRGVRDEAERVERERLLAVAEAAQQEAERLQRRAEAAQHRAEEAQRAAEAADRTKSDFLATMSHEIRTPINAILGYADLMDLEIAGPLTTQQRMYLERLTTSGRHLLGLINEVLDLARVESGRLPAVQERVELPTVIETALALVGPQAAERAVTLDFVCHIARETVFLGDPGQVRQILVNLLANAVKFTDAPTATGTARRGGAGRILVACGAADAPDSRVARATTPERASAWVYVRVTDTGIGIPADQLEAIFEPFVQVERGRTRTRGGTGLGLAISRRLARLMGGDLTVESAVGVGSTFTLWLPAPVGAETGVASTLPPSSLDQPAREGLYALGEWLAHEAEGVTKTFGERLRVDAEVPVAQTLNDVDLVNHISTYLIDIAKVLATVADSEEPTAAMQDGSDIQQLISERHGAQRQRLGFTEAMLKREFALLEEHLAHATRTGAPAEARPALERGIEVLTLFVRLAGRISLRGFRHSQQGERTRAGATAR